MFEIYYIILVAYAILFIGVALKNFSLSALGSIALIVIGVNGIIEGIGDFSNLVTYAFSVVSIGIGIYVLIRGTMEIFTGL